MCGLLCVFSVVVAAFVFSACAVVSAVLLCLFCVMFLLLCAAFPVVCPASAAAFGSPTVEKPTLAAFDLPKCQAQFYN